MAFEQRALKSRFKSAGRAADVDAITELSETAPNAVADAFGGLGGGAAAPAAGARANRPAVTAGLYAKFGDESESLAKKAEPVKRIGAKTFYRRADRYVDSDATKEQIDAATEIERFSDEYFDLLEDLGDESKEYLAEETEVLVVLKGKAYLIVDPKEKKKK